MELRRLRYFLAVATHRSMAAAASAIDVAQPTLSQQIRALEVDLGSILFDRTGRGMELTAAGQLLQPHAERLIAQADAARIALQEHEGGIAGEIRLGVIHTYNTAFMPRFIRDFARSYSGVRLLVEEGTAAEVEERILRGIYDLGLAFAPPIHAELGTDVLFDERLVLVTSPASKHARRRTINLKDVANIPLALLTRAFATRRLLDDKLPPGATLDIRIEMNSVEALIELARRDVLPTVLADRSLTGYDDLAMIPIVQPQVQRRAALLWDTHRYQTRAAIAFMDVVRKALRKQPNIRQTKSSQGRNRSPQRTFDNN